MADFNVSFTGPQVNAAMGFANPSVPRVVCGHQLPRTDWGWDRLIRFSRSPILVLKDGEEHSIKAPVIIQLLQEGILRPFEYWSYTIEGDILHIHPDYHGRRQFKFVYVGNSEGRNYNAIVYRDGHFKAMEILTAATYSPYLFIEMGRIVCHRLPSFNGMDFSGGVFHLLSQVYAQRYWTGKKLRKNKNGERKIRATKWRWVKTKSRAGQRRKKLLLGGFQINQFSGCASHNIMAGDGVLPKGHRMKCRLFASARSGRYIAREFVELQSVRVDNY